MTQPLMSEDEIHSFGIEIVFGQLKKEGYEFLEVNPQLGMNPQIVAKKDGQLRFILVRTACYPNKGTLASDEEALDFIAHADSHNATCYVASVGIGNSAGQTDAERAVPVKGAGFFVSYSGLTLLTRSDRVRVFGSRTGGDNP